MSRTLKPLFRPEVIQQHLRNFLPPLRFAAAQEKFVKMASLFGRRDARNLREENLKPGFLSEVFGEVLGYRTMTQSPSEFTIVTEFQVPGRGAADAVLGRNPGVAGNVVAAVEVKGPLDPLDIPHGGRRLSAVEQGWDYATNLRCDWILVTSMAETRLYYKGADRYTCERFDIASLAGNETALRRFLFILAAERVVPAHGRSHLYDLLEQSKVVGENITKEFYAEYSRLRTNAFVALSRENPAADRKAVLSATQKLLDRILFCAFAEDRGLLPPDSVKRAFDHTDPYNPRTKWENFRGLFRSIDQGNPTLRIPRYNGGLFAPDPFLDSLAVPDAVCLSFKRLSEFDFRALDTGSGAPSLAPGQTIVDVEILGHIFEQSITDLERLRLELEGRAESAPPSSAKAKRKKEGAFYTPRFITRYITEHTIGPTLRERQEALRQRHLAKAKPAGRRALEDIAATDPATLTPTQREALLAFWLDWQEELGRLRILDPACGSGAFLIEAFDQLLAAYQDLNARLEAIRGPQQELLDLNRQILQQNLYGVDLNEEAVEICRLSLWIKTAESGKVLTDLDHTIRVGNSIIDDPKVHERAFDWHAAFPEVFADGGFDVVIGNPPYIRQEWLAPYKDYLRGRYKAFSGTADLYIYFVERGLDVLRPGGRLGLITSGTFARSASASEFRNWFSSAARFEALVNLGETMPFGPDTFVLQPTISVIRKQSSNHVSHQFPTLFIHEDIPASLDAAMETEGLICDETVFESEEWKFQPREITAIFNKLMNAGRPLGEVCNGRMYRGVLTGLNEAFIVDTPTRDAMIAKDARSAELLRPILKGEDLRPWYQDWEGRWLVFARRGVRIEDYPAILAHLEQFREQLEPRPEDWKGSTDSWPGRKAGGYKWYELQDSIDYHEEFDPPKIFWPDIQKLPRFSWDDEKHVLANTGYLLVPDDTSILAILQSRLFWFAICQAAPKHRLRAGLWEHRCIDGPMRPLPIVIPSASDRDALSRLAVDATAIARERHDLHRRARHRIGDLAGASGGRLNNALTEWWRLDFRAFREEVLKAFKAEVPVRERDQWETALRDWRADHDRMTARLVACEEEINDRVYRLFGLTPDEVRTLEDFQKRTKTFYPLGEV